MKIFISHSSKNTNYGNALVDLLTGVGINSEQIIFTSNDAFGIPTGQNIFNWLKNRISEKPYVIYLLSPEYYSSVACLNEMGAAWVVENEHTMIFTPNFDLRSYEFQNGALDPREIGFYINNHDRLTAFIESMKKSFTVTSNPVLINQKIRDFLAKIETFKTVERKIDFPKTIVEEKKADEEEPKNEQVKKPEVELVKKAENDKTNTVKQSGNSKFFSDLLNGKLKDEEVLLLHYALDAAKFKLTTGWQENIELENIRAWEDVHELNDLLSRNYSGVLRRFEIRKLTEISEKTSYGNPKEVKFTEEFTEELLNLPEAVKTEILYIVEKNIKKEDTSW